MCLYVLSTSGMHSSKKSLTETLSGWVFKDQLIDWLIYLSIFWQKMTLQVAYFSHLLQMCKTMTTSCCISKFIQFSVSFTPYLVQHAGPSGSLFVRFHRKSNHLSHSCDKPALERLKCQVVFSTLTAGLRHNLSSVYATALPLLCCKM